MKNYKEKYEQAMLRMNKWVEGSEIIEPKEVAEFVFPELKESENERIRKSIIDLVEKQMPKSENKKWMISWLEKQGEQKPDFCHHEVDLSDCSEKYRKAYYDGWNNCNQQHSQLKAEQKPAWSEEDEKTLNSILNDLLQNVTPDDEDIQWLKSLKERIKGE